MPRIVPSQVVSFIDRFPLTERNNVVQLSDLEPHVLSSALGLIEQIPDELLTMDGATYALLVEQQYRIEDILERWRKDADQGHQRYTNRVVPADNPLAIIRGALAKCPDESPAPSTSLLNFIPDSDLRSNLRNDMGSINRALSNGEWKAATVLAGSVIEALLLWALLQRPTADVKNAGIKLVASKALKKPPDTNLEEWVLHQYIEVSEFLKVIKPDTAKQTRLAKEFRNLIHPGRSQRTGQKCDRATALSAVAGAEHVIRDLTP
jgi:hypothetical protein